MPTLDDGRNAVNRGNFQQARLIYEAILQESPRSEDAWLGLAEVLTDTEDKRICYENVLKINKQNRIAREGLRSLEPEEDQLRKAFGIQPAAPPSEDTDAESDEETTPVGAYTSDTASAAEGETPTFILVAVGLALSVVVMAIGGGLVFYILTSLTSG